MTADAAVPEAKRRIRPSARGTVGLQPITNETLARMVLTREAERVNPGPISAGAGQRAALVAASSAGFPNLRLHHLRHAHAAGLIKGGSPSSGSPGAPRPRLGRFRVKSQAVIRGAFAPGAGLRMVPGIAAQRLRRCRARA